MSSSREKSTVHKHNLTKFFVTLPNSTSEDPNISWAAKGLLWYIMSRPENWEVHTWQLAEIYEGPKRGGKKDAIQEMLKELREAGYVNYTKSRNSMGYWEHRYDVYPCPVKDFQKFNPQRDNPELDEPALVKPVVITSKELPRKELTKKEYLTESSSSSKEGGSQPGQVDDCLPAADDDACGADKFSSSLPLSEDSSDVVVTKTNGDTLTMSQSVIYRHFSRLPYDTDTVREAIQRLRTTSPVNNILKYLEATCKSIVEQKNRKPNKTNNNSLTETKKETEDTISPKPKKKTMTMLDYYHQTLREAKEKQ